MANKKETKPAKAVTAPRKKAAPKATGAKKTAKAAPKKKAVAAKKPVKAKAAAAPKKKATAPAKDATRILAENVVRGILEKKGKHVVCLDLRKIENAVFDYFIICEGDSTTQVDAIGESVVDYVKKVSGERPYRSEGWQNSLWILVDYINVVVHVFERDTRLFYNLESLWADAEVVDLGIK
jgi:ribosome-associated protein